MAKAKPQMETKETEDLVGVERVGKKAWIQVQVSKWQRKRIAKGRGGGVLPGAFRPEGAAWSGSVP